MYRDMLAVSVDDDKQNLMLIEVFANELNLNIKSFLDPIEALDFAKENQVDILFIDYMMPELDGISFIKEFRLKNDSTPIIMITASGNVLKTKIESLKAGATDFLNKPLDLFEFTLRTKNLLNLRRAQKLVNNKAKLLKEEVSKATKLIEEREYETLNILAKVSEFKDYSTAKHIVRVGHYAKLLASEYGFDEDFQEMIFYAAQLHDIGKVGIADKILLKPGRFNEEDFEIMKEHSQIGYDILTDSKSKYLRMGAQISLTHHERWDGTGYPSGLKENLIPMEGKIVAICDCFDALTSKRPYKDPWSFEESFAFIIENKGTMFDPQLVDIFVENKDKVFEIYKKFSEGVLEILCQSGKIILRIDKDERRNTI